MRQVAVILAGGIGERFWPLSTPERPKQLLKLTGDDRTLLQHAIDRAEPIFTRDHIFVATGEQVGAAICREGSLPSPQILIEPVAKNTLGALVWAVAELQHRGYGDDTVMAILTADHAIEPADAFRETVVAAMDLAVETQGLVTIGIPPTRAETGFGYIRRGESLKALGFYEKPTEEVAHEFVASGEYLWNSGMFFWTIGAFMGELRAHAPAAAAVVEDPSMFDQLVGAPIDKALMERSDKVYVVPARFGWDDVGAWDALSRTHAGDEDGNILVGDVTVLSSSGSIVFSEGMSVGLVGVENLIVVATPEGILVCDQSQAQRVRELVAKMKANGRP